MLTLLGITHFHLGDASVDRVYIGLSGASPNAHQENQYKIINHPSFHIIFAVLILGFICKNTRRSGGC
jgi:hypothetical protein